VSIDQVNTISINIVNKSSASNQYRYYNWVSKQQQRNQQPRKKTQGYLKH